MNNTFFLAPLSAVVVAFIDLHALPRDKTTYSAVRLMEHLVNRSVRLLEQFFAQNLGPKLQFY